MPAWPIARAVFVCATVVLAGCSFSGPVEFRLNTEGRDPAGISSLDQREAIVGRLAELFGTPDRPAVPEGVGLQPELLRMAAGPIGSDAEGNRWGLYRRHCAACHGISGDGAGPVAALLDPYPRDFRNGVFKYTSTAGGAKPTREDLKRGLLVGNTDTGMPSFVTLPEREIDALIEYVEYLSIRGETELFLLQEVVDLDRYPVDRNEVIDQAAFSYGLWAEAEGGEMVVEPPEPPPTGTQDERRASIERGSDLYRSQGARCNTCHGPEGRGDGEQSELYDDWNKPKTTKDASWFRLPIQRLRPRDFTRGVFRGGDRPIDIYWRIYVGIKGTPMPAHGPVGGSPGVLTPEEIWHVVNYVRSLGPAGR